MRCCFFGGIESRGDTSKRRCAAAGRNPSQSRARLLSRLGCCGITSSTPLAQALGAKPPRFIPRRPVYFVTVIDKRQVVFPYEFDPPGWEGPTLRQIRQAYAEALIGLNYVGLLDVALYVSAQKTHCVDRFMQWHVHLLVWGISEAKLRRFCKDIRIGMRALLSYATSVEYKRVRDGDLLQMVWYTTKAPRKQYQVWKRSRTDTLKQYKRKINGVNSVRLYAAMQDIKLDELTIAAGHGIRVMKRALNEVRQRS
jgi:hypothetical protein